MKREIKFRGKSIYGEEWLYGSVIKIEEGRYAIIMALNGIEVGKSISMYEVYSETVGQFTGMLDKNGKEIYEGDILFIDEYNGCRIYNEVGIKDGCFGYIGEVTGELIPFCYCNVIEVVAGNIYDTPELLKGENQ